MDNDTSPIRREEEETRQVSVWTPEDAARFLSSAIQESQRPLTEALRQRSVSPGMFALVILLLVASAAGSGWILLDRLDKSEMTAETARRERDIAINQRNETQIKTESLAARLSASQESAERALREKEAENARLRTETAGLKGNEDELKRLRADIQRHRRHNELLRNQISGLEMEKQALARQLNAVKALALSDDGPGDMLDEEWIEDETPEPLIRTQASEIPPAPSVPDSETRRGTAAPGNLTGVLEQPTTADTIDVAENAEQVHAEAESASDPETLDPENETEISGDRAE